MQTKTRTFTSPHFGSVRTAGTPENPLFCLTDLGRALGLRNPIHISDRLRKDDKSYITTSKRRQGRYGGIVFVTIRGMRDALLNSKSKKGDLIYSWLSRDVVPVLTSAKKQEAVKAQAEPNIERNPFKNGVIPFEEVKRAVRQETKAKPSLEDFILIIGQLDKVTEMAAEAIAGLTGAKLKDHLDALLESTFKSKDAILDIMKDIVLCTDYRGVKSA